LLTLLLIHADAPLPATADAADIDTPFFADSMLPPLMLMLMTDAASIVIAMMITLITPPLRRRPIIISPPLRHYIADAIS